MINEMIVINNIFCKPLTLDATKFQGHWRFGSEEADLYLDFIIRVYGYGGRFSHDADHKNFRSPVQERLHLKYGFSQPRSFRVDV